MKDNLPRELNFPVDSHGPKVMENREFVGLEEEDIQALNRIEAKKFEQNTKIKDVMSQVEEELGSPGRWEEHWLTTDASGRRVYARVYYTDDRGAAIASNGQIFREFDYPPPKKEELH